MGVPRGRKWLSHTHSCNLICILGHWNFWLRSIVHQSGFHGKASFLMYNLMPLFARIPQLSLVFYVKYWRKKLPFFNHMCQIICLCCHQSCHVISHSSTLSDRTDLRQIMLFTSVHLFMFGIFGAFVPESSKQVVWWVGPSTASLTTIAVQWGLE